MSKGREKQLQKRKQETLEVALRLLMERGYANLNMDELADEVGISKPTLYQYFTSKEELVAQVLVHTFEKMEGKISELSEKSPLERLERFLRAMLKSRHEKHNLMAQIDTEFMRTFMKRNLLMKERMIASKDKLTELVIKAQEQGEIDPALPAWIVVNMMFTLQGIIHNPFMKEDPQRSDEELDQTIEYIVRIFKRSVSVDVPATVALPH